MQFRANQDPSLLFLLTAVISEEVAGDLETVACLVIEEDVQVLVVEVVLLPKELPQVFLLAMLDTVNG